VDQHEWEMALTRADFLRLLPEAVQGPFRVDGDQISGGSGDLGWQITLSVLEPRRIALLVLPRLRVELTLRYTAPATAAAWLQRFMLGFQRAGG
jgi:hypothetical protein